VYVVANYGLAVEKPFFSDPSNSSPHMDAFSMDLLGTSMQYWAVTFYCAAERKKATLHKSKQMEK